MQTAKKTEVRAHILTLHFGKQIQVKVKQSRKRQLLVGGICEPEGALNRKNKKIDRKNVIIDQLKFTTPVWPKNNNNHTKLAA